MTTENNTRKSYGLLAEVVRFIFLAAVVGTFITLAVMLVLPFL